MVDSSPKELTASLEDYLETIYTLQGTKKLARVKDIAKARNVRPASVTPAMRRLATMGLVQYRQREYIELTEEGEVAARKVLARHQILVSFFRDVLNMPDEAAERDACAMEHHLSDQAMERLVRFIEFLHNCPGRPADVLAMFRECCSHDREGGRWTGCERAQSNECVSHMLSVADLKPGQSGVVTQVRARGAIRQRLLDMGILPDVTVTVERIAPTGCPIWIKLQNYQLSLRKSEAQTILLKQVAPPMEAPK